METEQDVYCQDIPQKYNKVSERLNLYSQSEQEQVVARQKIVQYNIAFDMQQYQKLREMQYILNPQEYQQKLLQADAFIDMQLNTMLGERYNRALSTIEYECRKGQLYGQNTDEPAIEMWKRGRDYRKAHGSTAHDQLRESAEVQEFEKIDIVMNHKQVPVGTMVVCFSPPSDKESSIYKHNFYDIYTKTDSGAQMRRYSSNRSLEEYKDKIEALTKETIEGPLSDLTFKDRAIPIIIIPGESDIKTADDTHHYFHSKHEVMEDETFAKIVAACTGAIERYKTQLREDPKDKRRVGALYNLILLSAQEALEKIKNGEETKDVSEKYGKKMNEDELYCLASQRIERLPTGCGDSGGVDLNENGMFGRPNALVPFNVASFGIQEKDQYGSLEFECSHCKKKNRRPLGKLIDVCGEGQNGGCGRSVRC